MIKITPPPLIICHSQTKDKEVDVCKGESKYEESVYNYSDTDNCLEAKSLIQGNADVWPTETAKGNARSLWTVPGAGTAEDFERKPHADEHGGLQISTLEAKRKGGAAKPPTAQQQPNSGIILTHSPPAPQAVCLQM